MPRNAAKRTNNKTKRLPVFVKLISKRKKRVNSNKSNNHSNNSSSNKGNNSHNKSKRKTASTPERNRNSKKSQKFNSSTLAKEEIDLSRRIHSTCNENSAKGNSLRISFTPPKNHNPSAKVTNSTPQRPSKAGVASKDSISKCLLEQLDIFSNRGAEPLEYPKVSNSSDATNSCKPISAYAQLSTPAASVCQPSSGDSPAASSASSQHIQLSTLYPIVIERHISEQQINVPGDLNAITRTTLALPSYTQAASAVTTSRHSTIFNVACCEPAATITAATTTATGVDGKSLVQHPKEQPLKKSTAKTSKRRQQQQQQQKQQQQEHLQHPQEVKDRLATLRTRKVCVANEKAASAYSQQRGQPKLEDIKGSAKVQTPTTTSATITTLTSEGDAASQQEDSKRHISSNRTDQLQGDSTEEASLKRRALPQPFDAATLNRIDILSDNEVKKPNNKRKRNQNAALLGYHIPPARSKRIAAAAAIAITAVVAPSAAAGDSCNTKASAKLSNVVPNKVAAVGGVVAGVGGAGGGSFGFVVGEKRDSSKQQAGSAADFLKPLPLEAPSTTNYKKRPRIMSLYERPYQSASEGRGGTASVVSNGYMSTSRSSSSGGGASSGGAMIISDNNDGQEVSNQYYLSGSSGSALAGNLPTSALLGNGSAINHAPTMGTLCNIGNTCYLNSVVYTLRFAPQFLHNLHHLLCDLNALQQNIARSRAKSSSLGRGISALQLESARSWSSKDLASMEQYAAGSAAGNANVAATTTGAATALNSQITQKSSHQVLTEKLHDLYQSLYRNEMSESTEPHHADTLLHAIQDVSTIFEGNQQQDAHEFLMCLLNSIRETSQTLIKAIAECPDVILNGYISNPEDMERDLKHSTVGGAGAGNGSGSSSAVSNISVTSALSSFTSNSKSSLFFSRKSKRKDESKNSKSSRLQSPLKDQQMPANLSSQSNSLFYLNANDLNSSASAATPSAAMAAASGSGSSITSPSNSTASTSHLLSSNGDEVDSTSLALLLKDKQRLEGKIRELGLDFFNEDFEGITVSTTKCLSCETVTEQKETMIDIAVPVPQAGYESNEYMDRPSSFIQNSCITREYFRNENKYRCEQCCGYTEAIRSISYEVLPRLLIIQLSRFSGGMEKINSYIPTSFTLQCFCSKCCELSDANKLHIYKLYSVITHVGATMSVGHYIAYTCSLDWANEYINCPKEQRRRASQEKAAAAAASAANGSGNGVTLGQTAANSQLSATSSSANAHSLGSSSSSSSSTTGFMKMMKFGRNKASSSGDMSKNVKQINGITSSSKAITNGIGKLSMNSAASGGASSASPSSTTCQSINCCAMRLTAQQQLHSLQISQTNASELSDSEIVHGYANGSSSTLGYNATSYNNNIPQGYSSSSSTTSGYGSTGRGATKASYASQNHNGSEPIWYMCDDDKIKAMTQREFEELLSPARKITITPYLLFYARYNLQTSSSPPKSASGNSSSPGPMSSSPQASWSNESLQSSGHSGHSAGGGLRM